ncbi:MAG TPA: carboxypeptidase-like regulatory domain-containing protein, partial [Bryobacteraceae bacterium]|nr:carboxypeptidase-like regulatory domain-containing protein [Bryobacteraceae bacterium]
MSRNMVWLCLALAPLPMVGQDLPQTYSIAGTVVQSVTRAPLPRTRIHLYDYQHQKVLDSTLTSSSGEFRFSGLTKAKYSLRAEHDVYGSQIFGNKILRAVYGSAVAVGPGLDSENLVFELIPGGVIKGIVRDSDSDPAPRIRLLAYRLTGPLKTAEAAGFAESNDLGAYRFHGLPQGRYIVSATGSPWNADLQVSESLATYPTTYQPGTTNLEQARLIDVAPGIEAQADITMTPVRAVNLTIRVSKFDCSDRNMAFLTSQVGNLDIPATAYRLSARSRPAKDGSEQDCSLYAGSVTPGKYVLNVTSGLAQLAIRTTIEVEEGREVIEVPLTPPATVTGRLTVTGAGINPPMVYLRVEGSPRTFPARVQADGTFRFEGVPAY